MGIIKGALKVVGSAALTVTGVTSGLLKGSSDAIGFELGSEIFGAAKNASFNGINSMWSTSKGIAKFERKVDKAGDCIKNNAKRTANQAASLAKSEAEKARREGNEEKYEFLMKKYNSYSKVK